MILTVGRKAAFTVCALSQLPQKDVIGDLRDLFPQRIALAMRSRSMTDAVLGPGRLRRVRWPTRSQARCRVSVSCIPMGRGVHADPGGAGG